MPGMIADRMCLLPSEDRRRKLTQAQKDEIVSLKDAMSIHGLAREYGVSRRTIQFILYPERHAANRAAHENRGGWQQYYDKDQHREAMARCRAHKNEVRAKT